MSTTKRATIILLTGGMLLLVVLAATATWALTGFTLGPQTYNGVVLPPQDQLHLPNQSINDWLAGDLPAAWAVRSDAAVTGTYGKFPHNRGTGVVSVDVPSDWGTINVFTGQPLELVLGYGQIKNVTAYLAPVRN